MFELVLVFELLDRNQHLPGMNGSRANFGRTFSGIRYKAFVFSFATMARSPSSLFQLCSTEEGIASNALNLLMLDITFVNP